MKQITFGQLKTQIEEIVGFKISFDDKGLVVKYPDITYYVGYENQSLILSNSKSKAKAVYMTNALESILRAFKLIGA